MEINVGLDVGLLVLHFNPDLMIFTSNITDNYSSQEDEFFKLLVIPCLVLQRLMCF